MPKTTSKLKKPRIFLSHASDESIIAQTIKTELMDEVGADFFIMPDDAPPGVDWFKQIQAGLKACTELFSLVTPFSAQRPWIAAEWACFALRGKPWTTIRLKLKHSDLFEPMSRHMTADFTVPDDIEVVMRRIAKATGVEPKKGFPAAASKLARDIQEAIRQARLQNVDKALASVEKNSIQGTDNLASGDVETVIQGGKLPDAMQIFQRSDTSDVKRRQFGVALVSFDRLSDALKICEAMGNKNEIKNVAQPVVDRTPQKAPADSEEWTFLIKIFDLLNEPQRRVLWLRMMDRELLPRGVWSNYKPKPADAITSENEA
jgi:hypothetical protein